MLRHSGLRYQTGSGEKLNAAGLSPMRKAFMTGKLPFYERDCLAAVKARLQEVTTRLIGHNVWSRRAAGPSDLDNAMTGTEYLEEVDTLARSLEVFRRNAADARLLYTEQMAEQETKQQVFIAGYIATFESGVRTCLELLPSAASERRATYRGTCCSGPAVTFVSAGAPSPSPTRGRQSP